MSLPIRDPKTVADQHHDLIIIGGGIYGAMLALESACRGLRPLLIERDDFGARTSFNSLRIVHGGLRYLQTFDIPRFFESVRERRWFLRHFPDLVTPLPCLMPLYGRGLRRNVVMRAAFFANDALSAHRNRGLPDSHRLAAGRILAPATTADAFPAVERTGLTGGALWHDAAMSDSQRFLIETLRWAVDRGARVLNYVEAAELVTRGSAVEGMIARDRYDDAGYELRAPVVINAAGPWSREVATRFDCDHAELFRPSLAWNILLDMPALSDYAIAVGGEAPGSTTYFLRSYKGRCMVGTGHSPWGEGPDAVCPTEAQISATIAEVAAAIPGADIESAAIARIFAGQLPAKDDSGAQLSVRPASIDHGRRGGPRGLFSVAGVKFTTARDVAATTLEAAGRAGSLPRLGKRADYSRRPRPADGWRLAPDAEPTPGNLRDLERLAREEWVVRLDDLIFRRTPLWENPRTASLFASAFCEYWASSARERELHRLDRLLETTGHLMPQEYETGTESRPNQA